MRRCFGSHFYLKLIEPVRTIKKMLNSWLQRDVYSRLFIPIVVLILSVGAVRYRLLIDSERLDAVGRAQNELRQTAHYIEIELIALTANADQSEIGELMESEMAGSGELAEMTLTIDGHRTSYQNKKIQAETPLWFVQLIGFKPLSCLLYTSPSPRD